MSDRHGPDAREAGFGLVGAREKPPWAGDLRTTGLQISPRRRRRRSRRWTPATVWLAAVSLSLLVWIAMLQQIL